MNEAEEIVALYREKHGEKIEAVLTEAFKKMVAEHDGDSLFHFLQQLVTMVQIVHEHLDNAKIVTPENFN